MICLWSQAKGWASPSFHFLLHSNKQWILAWTFATARWGFVGKSPSLRKSLRNCLWLRFVCWSWYWLNRAQPHTLEILEMYHSISGCGDFDNPSRNNYTSQHLVKLHCNARRCLTASRFVCCLWVAGQGGHKWGGRRRIRRFSSSFTLTVYCWGSVVLAFCCETPWSILKLMLLWWKDSQTSISWRQKTKE